MLIPAVTFYKFVLALHIAAILIAFGVTFAYPVMYSFGMRAEPRSMPGFHRIQDHVGKLVISPFMGLALVCGIYLASKLEAWSRFYVQWGLGVIIVLGALGGMFFSPKERQLAAVAERDVAAAGEGEVVFSVEYKAIRQRIMQMGLLANVLILLSIYFMVAQTGA